LVEIVHAGVGLIGPRRLLLIDYGQVFVDVILRGAAAHTNCADHKDAEGPGADFTFHRETSSPSFPHTESTKAADAAAAPPKLRSCRMVPPRGRFRDPAVTIPDTDVPYWRGLASGGAAPSPPPKRCRREPIALAEFLD